MSYPINKAALRGVVLSLSLLGAGSVNAASVEEIANYKGVDRQAVLEAGAKKEGSMLLYAVATQLEPIMNRFREKYPYIRLEMGRSESADLARRIVEEDKAGRHTADGFESTAYSLLFVRENGLLQSFTTPEMAAIDERSIEASRLWVSARESYGGIGYNSQSIPPANAPKTWQDLLNPEFKGKMGVTGSIGQAANWLGLLHVTYGDDYVKKLAAQQVKVFNLSSRALANLTVTGEVPISARASNAHMIESKAKGATVEWVDPGPVAVTDSSVAILKKAPHPHAMMLMIDFLLSKEAQQMYGELGYDSARKDITTGSHPKEKVYLEQRPNFMAETEEWSAMFLRNFKTKG